MPIPIVFIHKSPSWYLTYSLHQARAYNPQSKIFLIGDEGACSMARPEERVDINAYYEGATAFAHQYQHLSTNPEIFELFCLQRWFVLREWMHREGHAHAIYLDSDVLAYEDFTAESERLRDAPMTVVRTVGPGNTFVHDLATLDQFCDYMHAMYTAHIDTYSQTYEKHLLDGKRGGISDMWALQDFGKENPMAVRDIFDDDGAIYDDYMLSSAGFKMDGEVKSIEMIGDRPYGTRCADGTQARFRVLHFAGGSKRYMFKYITRMTPAIRLRVWRDSIQFFFKRIAYAIRHRLQAAR